MAILQNIKALISSIIIFYPDTDFGMRLRRFYWKYVFKNRLGDNCIFHRGCRVGLKNLLEIGHDTHFGQDVSIDAGDSYPVYIGNYVQLARGVFVRSANHSFKDLTTPMMFQGHSYKEILFNEKKYSVVIEDDVWLAANVIVLSGAHIGKGSVIGAGSVVRGVIPPFSIVVGNPGQIVSTREQRN